MKLGFFSILFLILLTLKLLGVITISNLLLGAILFAVPLFIGAFVIIYVVIEVIVDGINKF